MPYRPEGELKRPDLKGEFLCGHCGKTFCHAASLNRHRLNFHGDDQQCQLCDAKIGAHETVRRHMSAHHNISRVFTCGCCNWTFPDKKELHAHNNSMVRTGQPGEARAIAISNRTPGSLGQAQLRPESSTSPTTVSPNPKVASVPRQAKKKVDGNTAAEAFYRQLVAARQSAFTLGGISTEWLSALMFNNPSLFPLPTPSLMQQSAEQKEPMFSSAVLGDLVRMNLQNLRNNMMPAAPTIPNNNNNNISKPEELIPTSSSTSAFHVPRELQMPKTDEALDLSQNVKEKLAAVQIEEHIEDSEVHEDSEGSGTEEIQEQDEQTTRPPVLEYCGNSIDDKLAYYEQLKISIRSRDHEEALSGPESGIGSGEEITDSSPIPSEISKEGSHSPLTPNSERHSVIVGNPSRKRKSVDAIASFLFKQKQQCPM